MSFALAGQRAVRLGKAVSGMGKYLNSPKSYLLYKSEAAGDYFVDKTQMLRELIPLVERGSQYICVSRPRRFGKTVAANMIGAFFGKGADSSAVFQNLSIAECEAYGRQLNRHDVIHISFQEMPRRCKNFGQYITRIEQKLVQDLQGEYPDCRIEQEDAVWDILEAVAEEKGNLRFVFVLDEWDFIFHQDFVSEQDKKDFLLFLNNLLKDRAYVSLAYMTGILPIAKYSGGSELNMFLEYTMSAEERFSQYFGFTEAEVDSLYGVYLAKTQKPEVTREGLDLWYNGYHTRSGERVYNPRSVVAALSNNNLGGYWTSSGPYDEISYYIEKNVADVRDALAYMVSGIPVSAKIREYAAASANLRTRDEIFSAMIVYGFLSYENGMVSIPNKELMDQFADMLCKEASLGYVYRLAKESDRMLAATLNGDTDTMTEILAFAHDTETPLLSYHNETDLKVDHTPKEALRQIKERKYALKFEGRTGEKTDFTGRILAVGIAYDRKTKKHSCEIEVLDRQ